MPAWLDRLLSAFRGAPPVRGVAAVLAERMRVAPPEGEGPLRMTGSWGHHRCQVVLDGEADRMTVTVRMRQGAGSPWTIAWVATGESTAGRDLVSRRVALSHDDAQRLERLPVSVRLHVIEVVEKGRGEVRFDPATGTLRLEVTAARFGGPTAAADAATRLDVLADLADALPGAPG